MLGAVLGFKGLCELDTPFVLQLGDTQQCSTHYRNHDAGEEAKRALPDVLGASPVVFTKAIESADQTGTDENANDEPRESS